MIGKFVAKAIEIEAYKSCLLYPGQLIIPELEKIEPYEKTYPETLKRHTQRKTYISAHAPSLVHTTSTLPPDS